MQVILVVRLDFTDDTGYIDKGSHTYEHIVEMPISPVGLQTVIPDINGLAVHVAVTNVAWNVKLASFVVTGQAKVTAYHQHLLTKDQRWKPFI